MSTVFLDSLEENAITAALIERTARLRIEIDKLLRQSATEDRDFALACNRQALRHTELALLKIAGGLPDEPEQADPITAGKAAADLNPYPEPSADWQENELAAAWGR